ncbi:MAG: hypothetical protein OXN17_18995 [Candidatus Poribacteria bacterium]|nr:hypothetical protein [Candidatus Poribacteria bacterium]MDE0505863.1 hypothetical protein [Candidatus Poribacteria bacterium]
MTNTLGLTFILTPLLAIYLTGCAAKLEEPELDLAPLVRIENFVSFEGSTSKIGSMTVNASPDAESMKYLEDKKRQIARLEDRLNAYYRKALRRLTYLRLNNPLETPIIITDIFKEIGDPIDAFYSDRLRRKSDLELGAAALQISLNDYIRRLISALEREDDEISYKMWKESKKDETDENPDSAR